eukprot:1195198-Prorocentrum_minimum.AAC.4
MRPNPQATLATVERAQGEGLSEAGAFAPAAPCENLGVRLSTHAAGAAKCRGRSCAADEPVHVEARPSIALQVLEMELLAAGEGEGVRERRWRAACLSMVSGVSKTRLLDTTYLISGSRKMRLFGNRPHPKTLKQ